MPLIFLEDQFRLILILKGKRLPQALVGCWHWSLVYLGWHWCWHRLWWCLTKMKLILNHHITLQKIPMQTLCNWMIHSTMFLAHSTQILICWIIHIFLSILWESKESKVPRFNLSWTQKTLNWNSAMN